MSYEYSQRKRGNQKEAPKADRPAEPYLDALRTGAAAPTQEQMGRRVDLPDAMRAKMEESFGADLSAVKLYESQSVADAGAEAVTQGANIAFAPGMLDFSSFGGQSLLGHEISHVVSQARGEVTGGGFLNDHALEARADQEGAMAAAGQQIAAPASAMSGGSAVSAAGPMQAKKKSRSEQKLDKMYRIKTGLTAGEGVVKPRDERWYERNLSKLSDEELDMLGDRRAASASQLMSDYEALPSTMGEGERKLRGAMSAPSMAMGVYDAMLAEFGRMGEGEENANRLVSFRSRDARKHANEQDLVGAAQELSGTGAGSRNEWTRTDEGGALLRQLINESAENRKRIYRGK